MNKKEKTNDATTFWEDLKSGHFASMIKESSKGNSVSSCEEVCNIMKPIFARHDDVEKMYCIFLDTKNKIIAIKKIASGSIRSATVHPREIIKMVL
jgi:DNA repair protein RadC